MIVRDGGLTLGSIYPVARVAEALAYIAAYEERYRDAIGSEYHLRPQ